MHNLSLAGAAEKKEYNSKGNDGIIIRCEESAADALLHEYFGKARIMTNKNGSFTAVINTDAESFEPWAMRHLRECEVLEPYELRERITESIRRSGYLK